METACKHLNVTGMEALRHRICVAQVAQLAPSSSNYSVTFKQMVKAEEASILAQQQAAKWAKKQYRDAATKVVVNAAPRTSVGSIHNVSFGKGIKAEYDKMIDEFAIALEQVIEDTSIQTGLQMAATLLDTIDLAKHAGTLVKRFGESFIAQMDRERDAYMRSYGIQKNKLIRAVRDAETAVNAIKKLGAARHRIEAS